MPNKNSIEHLETKKRVSLLERNLLTALQNINVLTLEVERMRNVLASKEGFEDLGEPAVPEAPQQQQQQPQQPQRRGPMSVNMTSTKGRTLKVINN